MATFKKIILLIPISLAFLFLTPVLFGDLGEDNWFANNQMKYVMLFSGFILFSAIGYYINRSKIIGEKLIKWHLVATYTGVILILIGLSGHYYFDAQILKDNLDASHFNDDKTKLLALIFLAAAALVVGFCAYLVNMLISNYTKKNDS